MAVIKPFAAIRPSAEKADRIAALPYDVYNRQEAKEAVKGNEDSFLNIDRPETQFPDDFDMYSQEAYDKAKELLWNMVDDGRFIRDEQENYYIYELTMDGRSQTGIVACASIDDYENNVIKKHENTRAEKEADRIRHVDTVGAQTGPIFLAYRYNQQIAELVAKTKEEEPIYDFVSEDGISHRVWIISDRDDITRILKAFSEINEIYIADGHHRAASAVKVGKKRRAENPNTSGKEEYNYFLSVLFPDEELKILDYNRVVKDLNGMSEEELLKKLADILDLTEIPAENASPKEAHHFGMYLGDKWYDLAVRKEDLKEDPVKGLDVSLLQDLVLEPLFGITDPKTDARIDFVGGIRGMKELEKRVHEDCKVAFSMYPTSIAELFAVADAGLLMPPKSTWFEPKLRSGLFIHEI